MRIVLKLGILGLAGYGAVTAYQRLRPRLEAAGDQVANAVEEKIQPAVRSAVHDVSEASKQAVSEFVDDDQLPAPEPDVDGILSSSPAEV
jgi:hypothetical protein